ncbi:unnamed protein product [Rhizophagus irregularis]|nr:unnamed protein product [Rhizophagus irregularis]
MNSQIRNILAKGENLIIDQNKNRGCDGGDEGTSDPLLLYSNSKNSKVENLIIDQNKSRENVMEQRGYDGGDEDIIR